jgi:hypothetical protein
VLAEVEFAAQKAKILAQYLRWPSAAYLKR